MGSQKRPYSDTLFFNLLISRYFLHNSSPSGIGGLGRPGHFGADLADKTGFGGAICPARGGGAIWVPETDRRSVRRRQCTPASRCRNGGWTHLALVQGYSIALPRLMLACKSCRWFVTYAIAQFQNFPITDRPQRFHQIVNQPTLPFP
jgi:hypothetical protein